MNFIKMQILQFLIFLKLRTACLRHISAVFSICHHHACVGASSSHINDVACIAATSMFLVVFLIFVDSKTFFRRKIFQNTDGIIDNYNIATFASVILHLVGLLWQNW